MLDGTVVDESVGWSGPRERVFATAAAARERVRRAVAAEFARQPRDQVWAFSVPPEERLQGGGQAEFSPRQAPYPVLTAEEIAEAEAQFGVTFPEEYRSFLAQVGAGGDGPELELAELRKVGGRWGWITEDDEGCVLRLDASGPFIESEDWPDAQIETLRAAGFEPTIRDSRNDYLADYHAAFGEWDGTDLWQRQRCRGAVRISDNRCGVSGWLIVVGARRGEVRDRDCGFNPPFEPYTDASGARHTCRSWYLEWLEHGVRVAVRTPQHSGARHGREGAALSVRPEAGHLDHSASRVISQAQGRVR